MIAFVRVNFSPDRETLDAEIEIGTNHTLDPNLSRDVFVAVIAMVQRSFAFAESLP